MTVQIENVELTSGLDAERYLLEIAIANAMTPAMMVSGHVQERRNGGTVSYGLTERVSGADYVAATGGNPTNMEGVAGQHFLDFSSAAPGTVLRHEGAGAERDIIDPANGTDYSMAAIFRVAASIGGGLMAGGQNANPQFLLYVNAGTGIVSYNAQFSSGGTINSAATVQNGAWRSVLITHAVSGTQDTRLYVDDLAAVTSAGNFNFAALGAGNGSREVLIGSAEHDGVGYQSYNGDGSLFAFTNRCLHTDADELAAVRASLAAFTAYMNAAS